MHVRMTSVSATATSYGPWVRRLFAQIGLLVALCSCLGGCGDRANPSPEPDLVPDISVDASDSCAVDDARCASPTALERCVSGVWESSPCARGEVCDGNLAVCTRECALGERECIDESSLRVCEADGWVLEPCGPVARCLSGVCESPICEPGSVRCRDDDLGRVTCSDDGYEESDAACPPGTYCSAAAASTCVPQACTPGMGLCHQSGAYRGRDLCSASGDQWGDMPCAAGEVCLQIDDQSTHCACAPAPAQEIPRFDWTTETRGTRQGGTLELQKRCEDTRVVVPLSGAGWISSSSESLPCVLGIWVEGYGAFDETPREGCHTGVYGSGGRHELQADIDCELPPGWYTLRWEARHDGCGGGDCGATCSFHLDPTVVSEAR